MLYWLGQALEHYYGPFRLFTSHLFLGGLSTVLCFVLTFYFLPVLMGLLPTDRGRAHAIQSGASKGKPTGAGVIFVSIFTFIQLVLLPPSLQAWGILALTFLAMLSGYFDDRSVDSWGEYKKALLDVFLAVGTAALLCEMQAVQIWLPFTPTSFMIPPIVFIPFSAILIWTSINCTNCSDGVDGLSGTLSVLAFAILGLLLYFVVGHKDIANYLLLPHYQDGAVWGMMAFAMVGCILGYLWYNANPSMLLMGDAGSRALGFLMGVIVIKSGNPFTILIVSTVLLVNGGTGLVKVALLRFLKFSLFRTIRFPLHDHVRHNKGWSNTQVLVRFSLIQVMLLIVLLVILLKVR
ncbi:phospho-N-acetylmuramoyl-pentapeptide-transferase [Bdellovibrio bacteriovorus]|uniref:phospho-N-acetylmuramoyl-pentapeptide- transferase n=1 Tax=Bdellovibrio TaxID=958 RepID=UPI0035A81C2D